MIQGEGYCIFPHHASPQECRRIETLARELYFAYAQGRHESKSAPPWEHLPFFSDPASGIERNYWLVRARTVYNKIEGKQ